MDNIFVTYQNQKLKEVILYILNKTGNISCFMLMKYLFCAERANLIKWGEQMTDLVFFAREHGPLPSFLYNQICDQKKDNVGKYADILQFLDEYTIHPKREANFQYLSSSDIESLNKGINELAGMDYRKVESYLHDEVYFRLMASDAKKKYSLIDIAESGKASKVALDRIENLQKLSSTLL